MISFKYILIDKLQNESINNSFKYDLENKLLICILQKLEKKILLKQKDENELGYNELINENRRNNCYIWNNFLILFF